MISYRTVVLAAASGWFAQKLIKPYVLPYGPADPTDLPRPVLPRLDLSNDSLRAKRKQCNEYVSGC